MPFSYDDRGPVFPQSWNEYAYANNNPLALVDPLGLAPCRPTVKLHLPNENKDDEASGEFGPYEPQGDSAAGEQAADPPGYSGCAEPYDPFSDFSIDGAPVGGLGMFMDLGFGGPGGTGSAVGGMTICPSGGCASPPGYTWVPPASVADKTNVLTVTGWQTVDFGWENLPGHWDFTGSESCGLNPACDFLDGFSDLFFDNRPGEGVARLGGSLSFGVGIGVAGGPAAVGAAIADVPTQIQALAVRAYTSPAFWEGLQQFGDGLNPAAVPPATLWGAAGFAAGEIYQNWNNWF